MRNTSIVTGFGMVVALCLVLTQATAQETDAPPPAATAAEPALLEQLGVDQRPSGDLGLEELTGRIDKLTALLEQGGLPDDARTQVNALLLTDKLELEKREAAAAQPAEPATESAPAAEATSPSTDQPAATATDQAQPGAEETAPPAPEPAAEAATEMPPPPASEQPATSADQPAPSTAAPEQPPADAGTATATEPAPPEAPAATTAEPPAAPPEQPATTAAPEQPATATEATPAPPAQPSVEAPPAVSAAAETKAAALLADKTPAEALSDEALKARVEQSRALLDEPELSRKTAKALRQRLKADRQALRARVAAQEAAEAAAQQQAKAAAQQPAAPEPPAAAEQTQPTQAAPTQTQPTQQSAAPALQSKQQPQQALAPQAGAASEDAPLEEIAPLLPLVLAPTLAEIPLLLQDRRPAQDLADADLNRRIVAYREALQDEEAYSEEDLTLFDRQLRQDRQELNNRLLADRDERATVYQEWTNPNVEINTEPEPGEPQAPNSIFAAEVGEEEMWDQLVAAPLEPLPRRYSRHQVVEEPEFIMNMPEVRESMPSIELDTITFGFNEAFVREEEIFDLDRIARMIERLVAAHPDEIFMIEGHTDAVGSDAYNVRLSRQRAEAVKEALTRYYVIPPETLATVGLGERYLKIWTPEAEEENRRVTVRRVTPLVTGYAAEE
jgi:outer membrane protein OmpA-like peptidoglycan-associated protein